MKLSAAAACMAALLLLTSCNIFDPFDSPSDDAQIRSAARAAIDRGDFAEARSLYSQLGSQTDQDRADQAFMELDEAGVGMGEFMAAFGSGSNSAGVVITRLANSIGAKASATNREAIFQAYRKSLAITDNEQKALVKFISGVALIANILAEEANDKGNLLPTDISAAGSGQATGVGAGGCAGEIGGAPDPACAACSAPAAPTALAVGSAHDFTAETNLNSSSPDWGMIREAFDEINSAAALLGISSGSNALADLATIIGGVGAADDCTRRALINFQVGTK